MEKRVRFQLPQGHENPDEDLYYRPHFNKENLISSKKLGEVIKESSSSATLHGAPPLPAESTDQGTSESISLGLLDTISPVGIISKTTETDVFDGIYRIGRHSEVTPAMKEQLVDLLRRYRSTFAADINEMSCYEGPEGDFHLQLKEGEDRCFSKPRRFNPFEMDAIKETFTKLEKCGFIRPVSGEPKACKFAANPVVAMKKDLQGTYTETRVCLDYSKLNQKLEYEASYRFETAPSLHDRVVSSGNKFFSLLDNRSAFHAIRVDEESQALLGFWWPKENSTELYTWTRLPFGLASAPIAYSRRIVKAIEAFGLSQACLSYIDDTLIASPTWEAHLKHLEQYFKCLNSISIRLHTDKSEFAMESVQFLGFNCSAKGLTPAASKVIAIQSLPEPTNLKALQSALGFFNYYRSFVKDYSMIAKPLTALTKKDKPFEWKEAQARA